MGKGAILLRMSRKSPSKTSRIAATGQFVDRGVAGITADGVAIRKSPGRATHFTQREVEKAVAAVLSGRFQKPDGAKKAQHKEG